MPHAGETTNLFLTAPHAGEEHVLKRIMSLTLLCHATKVKGPNDRPLVSGLQRLTPLSLVKVEEAAPEPEIDIHF